MGQIITSHPDYRECILDIEVFGQIVSVQQLSLNELTESLKEEFRQRKPLPTLEAKRYELSRLVSPDFQVTYDGEPELQDTEVLVDLEVEPNPVVKPDLRGSPEPLEDVRDSFTYEAGTTLDIKQEIMAKYDLETLEEFAPGIKQTENIVGSVEEDARMFLSDRQIEELGTPEGELAEGDEDFDGVEGLDSSEGYGDTEEDDESAGEDGYADYGDPDDRDHEECDETPEEDGYSDYGDPEEGDGDGVVESDDLEGFEDDGIYDGYGDSDESEDSDDEDGDDVYEVYGDSGESEDSDDDDVYDGYGDEPEESDDAHTEDVDGEEPVESEELAEAEEPEVYETFDEAVDEEQSDDADVYAGYGDDEDSGEDVYDGYGDEEQDDDGAVDSEDDTYDGYGDSEGDESEEPDGESEEEAYFGDDDDDAYFGDEVPGDSEADEDDFVDDVGFVGVEPTPEFIPAPPPKPAPRPAQVRQEVPVRPVQQVAQPPTQAAQFGDRSSEPTEIRAFLRKHPRCDYQTVLQYFTKKQIDDAIRIGKIIKKGNILKI